MALIDGITDGLVMMTAGTQDLQPGARMSEMSFIEDAALREGFAQRHGRRRLAAISPPTPSACG